MASYFGEVVYPSSRAFWLDDDGEDESYEEEENVEFKINWIEPEPSVFNKFLVVEGQMAIDFVKKSLLEDVKIVCNIVCESDNDCTKIYLLNNDAYLCLVSTKVVLEHAGLFTTIIAPLLKKSKNIYTFTAEHMSRYKTDEEINSVSLLKTLCSRMVKSNKDFKDFEKSNLPPPNIVAGVCAGVLSYADILNLPCVLYILYTDTFVLDSKNALPLIELFSELIGKVPKIKNGDSSFFNKGNLYM